MKQSFLVLSANTPWVYALAEALAVHGAVTTVRFFDWANYFRLKPEWPEQTTGMRRLMVRLPAGYAGRAEPVFRPLLRALINREQARLREESGCDPIVVCPYPYLAPWVREVPPERLIYYNLDDYALYDLTRRGRTEILETELVRRARLSLCLSAFQVSALRARYPAAADRIIHFPLGVSKDFLNPDPSARPSADNTIGYIGNLTDRVDWSFFERVIELVPEVKFHILGGLEPKYSHATKSAWQKVRGRVLQHPNVVLEGNIAQASVKYYYWRYSINWMPYLVDHSFNRASCPTKIMDALASGRPFLSTPIPEALLYPHFIQYINDPVTAAGKIRCILNGNKTYSPRDQIDFASCNTWGHRANSLLALLAPADPRPLLRKL